MQHVRNVRKKQQDASWERTETVLIAIGNITIGWAGVVLMLNNLILWYQRRVGNVIRRDMPRMFTVKLDYLKAMEPDIHWSPSERSKLREIRLELARLNQLRIECVHGMLYQQHRRTGDWQVYVAKEVGNTLERRTLDYSEEAIFRLAKDISDVSHKMSPFFAGIIGLPHPEIS